MKKLISTYLISLSLIGCTTDTNSPYSYSNESTIYSDTKTTQFKELVIIIKPYILVDNQKKYIVTDTIKNVNIKINNKPWGMYNSFGIDTSLFVNEKISNLHTSNSATKYPIIAPYKTSNDTLTTAGEYSDLLNNHLTLEPGNYICQVESFEIKQSDGTIKKVKPFIIAPIEIKENMRSALVGEFEVQINNK
jgi:hypothetical protein